ncbi:adenylate/guanylate cyclase domain-containing protein [Gelidibacter salicanalis]|uniref:Adenylate/guanylate cyclase domain-containing protein n=1 Tax=Gelidibacter salicanalis TaxID=291193 RepID=A0A934KW54_9FLAO|nr:adenylate/guanylate cyclase domain-containing protein [Gelidibacter salicanalis]MBJ7883100.1 adenylate/guanylate cyclase domain-containing protein [Gelidibacter salicanalis]
MLYYIKQFFKLFFASVLFWSFAFCFFILIRYLGREQEQVDAIQQSKVLPVSEYLLFGVFLGVMVAIVYTIVEYAFDKFLSKALNLGLILVIKSIIYLLFLIFSLTIIAYLAEDYIGVDFPNHTGWWISNKIFWMVTAYFIICSLLFSFIRLANDKFGKGIMFKMLIGRYKNPREVEKIFMFLDMKSSTAHAEELGHLKYSMLIQDCFFYLNKIINKYDAEVYQYVGDEAVLSWTPKRGIRHLNCIKLFFDFDRKLKRHSKYYKKKYGIQPEFKAGLHTGKIIIAEVGTVKKELAYHGDVINSTSRIQEKCNDYNESLLISEDLMNQLQLTSKYEAISLGDELLDGKTEELKIFAIHRK